MKSASVIFVLTIPPRFFLRWSRAAMSSMSRSILLTGVSVKVPSPRKTAMGVTPSIACEKRRTPFVMRTVPMSRVSVALAMSWTRAVSRSIL